MKVYYGLVHKDPDSAYGITFPDLPGCFSAADFEDDIHEAAQAALTLYAQDQTAMAPPRSIPELQADGDIARELASGAVLLAIPLIEIRHKARFNVMFDADLMAGVDRKARTLGLSRSEYLSISARNQLASHGAAAVLTSKSQVGTRSVGAATSASKAAKSAAASALTQAAGAKPASKKASKK
jgi:predicted RNase H-like HicB family nuclease